MPISSWGLKLGNVKKKRAHFWFSPTLLTYLTIAKQFWNIKRPDDNLKVANLSSFVISFATATAALANCSSFPRVVSILYMAVPLFNHHDS